MTRSRRLALERDVGVMREGAAEPVTVGDVERLAGVNSRTLRYVFAEAFGLSPKAYLNRLRMNRVREDLLRGRAVAVGVAAKRWGFRHMGQFAHDYRRLFDELPSETSKRMR